MLGPPLGEIPSSEHASTSWLLRPSSSPLQAEIGVDAGAYARLLMVHAKEAADAAAEEVANGTLSAQAILESAFYRTNVQGERAVLQATSTRCSADCT
jgi:hypothetical protein